MTEKSERMGKASSAVSGSDGCESTLASKATIVAICGTTIVMVICRHHTRSSARTYGNSLVRCAKMLCVTRPGRSAVRAISDEGEAARVGYGRSPPLQSSYPSHCT